MHVRRLNATIPNPSLATGLAAVRERLTEDLDTAARRDPASRGRLELLLCYPGLHAVWVHRLAHRMWQRPGLKLAARYGQAWVTTGDPRLFESGTPEQSVQALRGQTEKLADACAAIGRDVSELDRILLTGFTPDRGRPLESVDAFVDFAGRHQELGFTEIVIHWPIPDSYFAADEQVFERIATEAPAQLR
jgi:hypothetical protein